MILKFSAYAFNVPIDKQIPLDKIPVSYTQAGDMRYRYNRFCCLSFRQMF